MKAASPGRRAFTLIEVVIAMAIAVFALLVLLATFSLGIKTTADSQGDTIAVFIADNVRAQLLADENWPIPADAPLTTSNNPTTFSFDESGELLQGLPTDDPKYQGRLTIAALFDPASPFYLQEANYRSRRLDYITLEIFRQGSTNRPLSTFNLMRHRLAERSSP